MRKIPLRYLAIALLSLLPAATGIGPKPLVLPALPAIKVSGANVSSPAIPGAATPSTAPAGASGVSSKRLAGADQAGVNLVVTSPLQLSASTVAFGGSLTGQATLQNQGSGAVTVSAIVIAGRPPGGTNSGGPYLDFGATGSVTLGPGQSITVQKTRTFADSDPTGTWYSYVSYQTTDGAWHDDGHNVSFTIVSQTSAALVVTSPLQLSADTVAIGGSLTGQATLQNQGSGTVTVSDIVIAGRPPGGTNSGGPYLDFGATGSVTLGPGQSITVQKTRTFADSDPTGTWYSYVTYRTTDGAWHDDGRVANFTVTSSAPGATSTPVPPVATNTPVPPAATNTPSPAAANTPQQVGGSWTVPAGQAAGTYRVVLDVFDSTWSTILGRDQHTTFTISG